MTTTILRLMSVCLAYFVWIITTPSTRTLWNWAFEQGVGVVILLVMIYFLYREYKDSKSHSRQQEENLSDMLEDVVSTRKETSQAIEEMAKTQAELAQTQKELAESQKETNELLRNLNTNE